MLRRTFRRFGRTSFKKAVSKPLARLSGSQRFGKDATSGKKRRTDMHAMRAEHFTGYKGLKLVDLPKPAVSDGKVLLRVTAAGVTPLDHTILSGHFALSKPPLVLGNEGAGVVDDGGGTDFLVHVRCSPDPMVFLRTEHSVSGFPYGRKTFA
jgi:hypothetical protein